MRRISLLAMCLSASTTVLAEGPPETLHRHHPATVVAVTPAEVSLGYQASHPAEGRRSDRATRALPPPASTSVLILVTNKDRLAATLAEARRMKPVIPSDVQIAVGVIAGIRETTQSLSRIVAADPRAIAGVHVYPIASTAAALIYRRNEVDTPYASVDAFLQELERAQRRPR